MDELNSFGDLDNEDRARMFEDASAFIAKNYPKALRTFYTNCNSEGFNPEQCMTMTLKYFEMVLLNLANSGSDKALDDENRDDSDSDSDSDPEFDPYGGGDKP
jgi:hypothetical protein